MKIKEIIAAIWLLLVLGISGLCHATVSSETTRVKYTCNGTSTVYAYPFKVLEDDDLLVIRNLTATLTDTTLVLNTDYTVSGAGGSGGNVTLTAASKCASGNTLTILRNFELTQETDYVDGEAFSAGSFETALDKSAMIQQQQSEAIGRSFKLPKTSSLTEPVLPNAVANHYLGWNSFGTALENKAVPVTSTATQYEIDALVTYGGGTAFTQATIQSALIAIGASNVTLLLRPGAWAISTPLAIPANVTLNMPPGSYFTYTGTGAITGLPVATPEMFGLVDGTADEVQINKAAAAATLVKLASKTYTIAATIALPSNSTLQGQGGKATNIIIGTAGIVAITPVTAGSDITIEDLGITGTDPVTDNDEKGIYAITVTRLIIQRCFLEKLPYSIKLDGCLQPKVIDSYFFDTAGDTTQGTAVQVNYCEGGIVSHNIFKTIHRHAVYLAAGTRNTVVSDNTIDGCANVALASNSYISSVGPNLYNIFSNNAVRNVTGTSGRGINLSDYSQYTIVDGNTIDTTSEYGISFEGDSTYDPTQNPRHNLITNNIIRNTTSTSIWIKNSNDNIISGNQVLVSVGTGISVGTSGAGIGSYSYRNHIVNNIIRSSATYGLNIAGDVDSTRLFNNRVSDSGTYDYYLVGGTNTLFEEPFYRDYADHSSSGTGADTLGTISIPAYYMGIQGGIRVTAAGTKTGAAGNKTIIFYWHTTAYTFHAAANNETDWRFEAEIVNTAANAQRISWKAWDGITITQGYEAATQGTTAARTVYFTGECANAGDVITQTMFKIDRF